MKFIVLFGDNPGAGVEVRTKHMLEHLEFLQRRSASVKAAGPSKNQHGSGAGGFWIVDAKNETAVRNLIEEAPLWPTGLRKSVRVLSWTQIFAEGQRVEPRSASQVDGA